MKKITLTTYLILSCLLVTYASENILETKDKGLKDYYAEQINQPKSKVVKARVIEIVYDDTKENRPNIPVESDFRYQHLKVKLLTGKHKGEVYTIRNTIELAIPYKLIFRLNEKMILHLDENENGKVTNLRIYERERDTKIYIIIITFSCALIIVGKKNGLKALISLGISITLIFALFLPLIIKHHNPIFWAFIICSISTIVTLLIIGGNNYKTYTAILGTIGGVMIAGTFAIVAGKILCLTGLGNEDAQMLAYIPQYRDIDYQGLLFAGIMIGSLGAVMDVAMSISSAMWEIIAVSPDISKKQLTISGMNIGKDIIGSMSNTLILAYVSTSIPVILLFIIFSNGFSEIINLEILASEILRAASGSIGLICTIPITVKLVCKLKK